MFIAQISVLSENISVCYQSIGKHTIKILGNTTNILTLNLVDIANARYHMTSYILTFLISIYCLCFTEKTLKKYQFPSIHAISYETHN